MQDKYQFHSIMLVDNNYVDNFLNERLLKKAEIVGNVTSFQSSLKALGFLQELDEKLENNHNAQIPELILLDMFMPEMDGFEFVEAFNHLSAKIKDVCSIVVVSGLSLSEEQKKALREKNVKDFMEKPMDVNSLKKYCLCSN